MELPCKTDGPVNIFTVDVEDWFHFEFGGFSVPFASWADMEGRVERSTEILLQLLAENHATATFFVLGWIGERYPALIQKISEAGHEIGCRPSHQLKEEFRTLSMTRCQGFWFRSVIRKLWQKNWLF
jgi:hypothetical protein